MSDPWPRRPEPELHPPRHHDELLPVDPDLAPDDPGEPSVAHQAGIHRHRSSDKRVLGAIAAGGFFGALARFEVGQAWPTPPGHMPWATFATNTSGALLLGVVLTALLERSSWLPSARPFLCVGVIGSWTTMSTFALEVDLLVKGQHIALAVGYGVLTVVCGIVLSWAGILLVRRIARRRLRWQSR